MAVFYPYIVNPSNKIEFPQGIHRLWWVLGEYKEKLGLCSICRERRRFSIYFGGIWIEPYCMTCILVMTDTIDGTLTETINQVNELLANYRIHHHFLDTPELYYMDDALGGNQESL